MSLSFVPTFSLMPTRNLYAGQEAPVRTGHETTNWFQTGKGVRQGCIIIHADFFKFIYLFLLAILITACASSRPAFCMIQFAYKLNKQGDNIQP